MVKSVWNEPLLWCYYYVNLNVLVFLKSQNLILQVKVLSWMVSKGNNNTVGRHLLKGNQEA